MGLTEGGIDGLDFVSLHFDQVKTGVGAEDNNYPESVTRLLLEVTEIEIMPEIYHQVTSLKLLFRKSDAARDYTNLFCSLTKAFPNLDDLQLENAIEVSVDDKALQILGTLESLTFLKLRNFSTFTAAFLLGERFPSLYHVEFHSCPGVIREVVKVVRKGRFPFIFILMTNSDGDGEYI